MIGGLAVALTLVVFDAYVIGGGEDETVIALDKSIAVLPFVNLSSDEDQEYFSDGLAEEILNKLAQVDDLRVAARTSSFAFKGENQDLRDVGESLGVAYVLEGSVRRSSDDIRITGQLIQADNGFHLWSDTFDRRMDDIFAVQDEIAEAVTTALSITIGAGAFDLPGMTRNTEAYDEYLKGASAFRQYSGASFPVAIQALRRATRIDPEFRHAWGVLGVVYAQALVVPGAGQPEELAAAAVAVLRELESIAPNEAATGVLRLQVTYLIDRDLMSSRQQSLTIVEEFTDTRSADIVLPQASLARARLGYAIEAEQLARRGQEIEPNEPAFQVMLALSLFQQGRIDEAFRQTEIGLEMGGYETIYRLIRRNIAHNRRDFDAALEETRAAAALGWSVETDAAGVMLDESLAAGNRDAVLDHLENMTARNVSDGRLAIYAAAIGEPELALRLWQPAETVVDLANLWYPTLRDMRRLPAFKTFVEDVGLVEVWRTTGDWGDFCRPIVGGDDFECE